MLSSPPPGPLPGHCYAFATLLSRLLLYILFCQATHCCRCPIRPPQARYLGAHVNKSEEQVMADFSRPRYFNPYEAVGYGLIDTVLEPTGDKGVIKGCATCSGMHSRIDASARLMCAGPLFIGGFLLDCRAVCGFLMEQRNAVDETAHRASSIVRMLIGAHVVPTNETLQYYHDAGKTG